MADKFIEDLKVAIDFVNDYSAPRYKQAFNEAIASNSLIKVRNHAPVPIKKIINTLAGASGIYGRSNYGQYYRQEFGTTNEDFVTQLEGFIDKCRRDTSEFNRLDETVRGAYNQKPATRQTESDSQNPQTDHLSRFIKGLNKKQPLGVGGIPPKDKEKVEMTDEEVRQMNELMGGDRALGQDAAIATRPQNMPPISKKKLSLPKIKVPTKVKDFISNQGSNFLSKGSILFKQFVNRYPLAASTLFTGALGAIVGGPLGGLNGALLGGGIGSALPTLTKKGVTQAAMKGVGKAVFGGLGRAALLTNPAGLAILAASFAPKVAWTAGKKIGLIVIGVVMFLILLLPGGGNLLESLAPLNPVGQVSSLIQPGGGYCDTSGFNILDTNAVTDEILNKFIQQALSSGLVTKGTDQEKFFQQRATFIRDKAKDAGLNPAVFLGLWKSESHFSDYANPNVRPGADLGCDPTNKELTSFEESVLCAIGKSAISNSRTSQCATSKDANSDACKAIAFQRIPLPISTLQNFLDSYGAISADSNNINTHNTVKQVISEMGLASCSIDPSGNFVYYCQGDPKWNVNGDNRSSCSLGQAGCGPTSFAMIFSSFGKTITPPEMFQNFKNNNWWNCTSGVVGMLGILNSQWLKDDGFQALTDKNLVSGGTLDLEKTSEYIKQGYVIVASHWIKRSENLSHIFVVTGADTNSGTAIRRDPMNCSYSTGAENTSKAIMSVNDIFGLGNGPDWIYAYPIKRVQ